MRIDLPVQLSPDQVRFVRRYARRLAVEFPAVDVTERVALSNLLWRAIRAEKNNEDLRAAEFRGRKGGRR